MEQTFTYWLVMPEICCIQYLLNLKRNGDFSLIFQEKNSKERMIQQKTIEDLILINFSLISYNSQLQKNSCILQTQELFKNHKVYWRFPANLIWIQSLDSSKRPWDEKGGLNYTDVRQFPNVIVFSSFFPGKWTCPETHTQALDSLPSALSHGSAVSSVHCALIGRKT